MTIVIVLAVAALAFALLSFAVALHSTTALRAITESSKELCAEMDDRLNEAAEKGWLDR